MTDRDLALGRLKAHRHYAYRACAPHWDNPAVCAADDTVRLEVFYSVDEEPQRVRLEREATAKRLCGGCPIVDACREYAIGDGPTVREPHQVWGGTIPSERREILARRLHAAQQANPEPLHVGELRTEQRQDMLRALAAHDTLAKVRNAARLTDRTTRWQISRLYTLLHVDKPGKDFDRLWEQRHLLLAAAYEASVLPAVWRKRVRTVAGKPRRDRFRRIPGQGEFDLFPGAEVIRLPAPRRAPRRTARVLEGAAA